MTENAIETVLCALGMKMYLAKAIVLHSNGISGFDKWLFIRHYDIYHMNDFKKRKFWSLK